MPVYVVAVANAGASVEATLKSWDQQKVYQLNDKAWLVAFEGTTQGCAETLNIRTSDTNKSPDAGVVFKVANYSGFFTKTVWEWLGLNDHPTGRE